MRARAISVVACLLALQSAILPEPAAAQSVVEQNSNVVGRTIPGYYRGIPAMQDNEASCAINPILPRNIVCAWNASGGSDDAIGDTWLRFSESLDGGRTFFNRYLNGSNLNPATSANQQFGADPVMMCWPGGCGTVMLASTRAERGGQGGGIYIQWMADLNTETGFRKGFKVNLDQIYRSTGSHFADKPHALYILDEDNPGTVPVSFEVDMPDGSTQLVEREWPKGRIIVVFALFNPSKNDIEILSTYTDDYGTNWSNPRQVAVTSGRDQGVSLAAIGNTVFYGFRRFANGGDADDIMGVVSNDLGRRFSKPFVVASDVCVYDVPTLPSTANGTAAAARTNDFPWVSQDGSKFIMVYSERRRSSDGGCLTNLSEPSDSRIMATVGASNGKNWSTPVKVDSQANHGFQFMPVVDCSLGICQVAWWDSRRDSARTRQFLEAQANPFAAAALTYFENVSILADFHFPFSPDSALGYQFRRTADMFTRKIRLQNGGFEPLGESAMASRYRLGRYQGSVVEREFNPFNVKAYKTNTVPFMSDYSSMTSVKHRYVFDPDNQSAPPYWESNAGPNGLQPNASPLFWLAWTDSRNMRGQIYSRTIDGQLPYARTPEPDPEIPEAPVVENLSLKAQGESLAAESVEDYNPAPGVCTPIIDDPDVSGDVPREGDEFLALNNRVKDSDIYGALIENRSNAWSLNPTKTLGLIQRTYVIVAENEDPDIERLYRFEIANQPTGFYDTTKSARASWLQLPFEPGTDDFQNIGPTTSTFETVGPRSSASVALFLVSDDSVNPVTVNVYDVMGDPEDPSTVEVLVNSVTVNGAIEAGPLLNGNGEPNILEVHNPSVYPPNSYNLDHYDAMNPDQFNPDQYNPDQFNPDLFNPDQYNPDQFNPDQFNPDQFNPDQYNPDQFNPDQFNPDQFNPDQFNPDQFNPDLFNPDQFNPDQFNPDQFNTNLSDSDDLHNREIPAPEFHPDFVRDADPDDPEGPGLVSKVDVNFGVENEGNTLTPYTVDFAIADPEVLSLISSGEIATQLIAWQNKQIDDVQFCDPRLMTENRVIAVQNNPDLTQLTIPTIFTNREGALTYFMAPHDILQMTLRFIGPKEKVRFVEEKLRNDIISYVFTSQAANTGLDHLIGTADQVVNDRTPPTFNFLSGSQFVEGNAPGGAILLDGFVTATKNEVDVDVLCDRDLDSYIFPVNVPNDDPGTELTCWATAPDNDVTAEVVLTINVDDAEAPIIHLHTLPANILREADTPDGTIVTYTDPEATDVFGVDPIVTVSCTPASGSLFRFQSPGPVTKVTCVASDTSGNQSDPAGPPPTTFTVTLQDTAAPVIDPIDIFDPDDPQPYELLANSSTFLLKWGPFNVSDADSAPAVACTADGVPATRDNSVQPPQYKFFHEFPVGSTAVVCTATDDNDLVASLSFPVVVEDHIAPVITLIGDSTITQDAGLDPYVDPGATAIDNGDTGVPVTIDIDSSAVDATTPGTYLVTITATDPHNNVSTATRTVIIEFTYGMTGIIPAKTNVNLGSSNPLLWAWLDVYGNPVDTSGEKQYLRIENCDTGELIINPAGDPGSSGFRFKSDNWWQFNWDSTVPKKGQYCAFVRIGDPLSGPQMASPRIRVR